MNANWQPGLSVSRKLWCLLRRWWDQPEPFPQAMSDFMDQYAESLVPQYVPPPLGVIRVCSTLDPVMREYRVVIVGATDASQI
jgi:hypothetical protein